MPTDEPAHAPEGRRKRRIPLSVRIGVMLFLAALVVEYFVIPQIAGAGRALHLLSKVHVGYLLLGVVLEAASLTAYFLLTRSVLPPHSAGLGRLSRIDLSTLALSHVVPGGTAPATGLGYSLLTGSGIAGPDAWFALGTQGIGSALVLNGMFWIALIVSIPFHPFNLLYAAAAGLGAVLIAILAGIVLLLTRAEDPAGRFIRAVGRRIPHVDPDHLEASLRRIATRLDNLLADKHLLMEAIAWAAANWLLDAASLWVFLLAFGQLVSPVDLLVAYGLAYILAVIPITPGGLGVVEGVLIATLSGFGVPKGVAILGVLSYRLVNFWVPIPAGGSCYLSLKLGRKPEAKPVES